jgi:hypothetical protein
MMIKNSHPSTITLFILFVIVLFTQTTSYALPAFANQTGQNCIACHAGGQYPELTPYGRMFKLTGYTIGERGLRASVMAIGGASKMSNPDSVNNSLANNASSGLNTPYKNGSLRFETASFFLAGKITDNIGAFSQVTYDNHNPTDAGGQYVGHSAVDGVDVRYADQFVNENSNIIYGVSLNNRPSIADPWNTAWGWMQYVPSSPNLGSNQYTDGGSNGPPYPGNGTSAAGLAGINGYAFLNKSIYAELGLYRTAQRSFRFLNSGSPQIESTLKGTNPYWRLAYNKDWGAHSWMLGTSGMISRQYDFNNPTPCLSDATCYQTAKVRGVDTQYQYLLDPHTLTLQAVYQRQRFDTGAQASGIAASDQTIMRAKASYVYQAKYGGSYSYFNIPGGPELATRGNTYELFYMPLQYVRLGLQYTTYNKLVNIDTPSDANTIRFYVWAAY